MQAGSFGTEHDTGCGIRGAVHFVAGCKTDTTSTLFTAQQRFPSANARLHKELQETG